MAKKTRAAFSLVEVLIVVALVGIIFSIVSYNYSRMKAKSESTICVNNLKQVQGAIERWALENDVPDGTTPDQDEV